MSDLLQHCFGNYRLVRFLGSGGFAEVYLGEHLHLGTQAAIKLLHRMTPEDQELFHQEARLVAHLDHPNIVRVLDFGMEGDASYLVMGYAPAGSLRQRHPKGTSLPLAMVVSYTRQVAAALHYAHKARIIHRDVKPANMLVGKQGEILLTDFGIAYLMQSTGTQSLQNTSGTVNYMAPEQLQGKPVLASDQYALAIVIYEWISGFPPFQGSFVEIAAQHMLVAPPSLLPKVPNLPEAVDQVVMKALAKDPSERFSDVQTFASALEQALFAFSLPQDAEMTLDTEDLPAPKSSDTTFLDDPLETNVLSALTAPPKETRSISRRLFLASAVGVAGVAVIGGGVTWYNRVQADVQAQNAASLATQQALATPTLPPTATPSPPGTRLVTYRRHKDKVTGLAWSPDGHALASSSYDKTAQGLGCFVGKSYLDVPWTYQRRL